MAAIGAGAPDQAGAQLQCLLQGGGSHSDSGQALSGARDEKIQLFAQISHTHVADTVLVFDTLQDAKHKSRHICYGK